jgi:hypothetical protein
MNRYIAAIGMVCLVFCAFLSAESENGGKIRLGGHFGYFYFEDCNSKIEEVNPGYLNGVFYGADAGFMITKNIELAASYTRMYEEKTSLNESYLPSDASFNDWFVGGYYHFMGIYEPINLKVGAGIDFGAVDAKVYYNGTSVFESNRDGVGYWFSMGAETVVSGLFNIGAEVIYLYLREYEDGSDADDEPVDLNGIRIKGFIKIIL